MSEETKGKWYEKYIDIKGLAKAVMERSNEIVVKGADFSPEEIAIKELFEYMELDITMITFNTRAREAKLEAELKRLEKEEKEVEE